MKRLFLLVLPLLALAGLSVPSFAHDAAHHAGATSIRVETIVPNVVGLAVTDVVESLEQVYRLEVVDVPARPRREGRVVTQVPRAGERLHLGDALRLEVGRRALAAVEQRPLPSVVGLDLREAERILLRRGLVPHPVVVRARHAAAWTILRQHPRADVPVAAGDAVRLEIAVPRRSLAGVRLPSLYGLDPVAATQALTTLGLRASLERRPSVFETDTVIATVPATGATLPAGSLVRLRVAVPSRHPRRVARVLVPDLAGRPLPAMRAAIREAGLRLEIRRRRAPDAPVGRALAQRPHAGAHLPLGTFVVVELPLAADVPDLVGQRTSAARRLAEEAGFALRIDGLATLRPDRVVAQVPAAGSRAAVGSEVRIVVQRRGSGPRAVPAPAPRPEPRAPARRGTLRRVPARR